MSTSTPHSTSTDQTSPLLYQLGIFEMPAHQRLALAQEIIASVIAEEAPPAPLTEAQLQELQRRIEQDDANPDEVTPAEVVHERILARLRS